VADGSVGRVLTDEALEEAREQKAPRQLEDLTGSIRNDPEYFFAVGNHVMNGLS